MSNDFWESDTYQIVKAMKASGNQPGIIQCWKNDMEQWARSNVGPDADAIKAWLPHWQIRPFYTAAELVPMWSVLAIALRLRERLPPVGKSSNRLENELIFAGLPYIGFGGRKYFIVEQIHRWVAKPPTQEELREIFDDHARAA